jgi:hypothetical protein
MRITGRLFPLLLVVVGFCATFPAMALAAGGPTQPASRPKPDTGKKVWTNDDFPSSQSQTASPVDLGVAALVTESATSADSEGPSESANPEQDPRFYIERMASLEGELASVEDQEQRLRSFRETGAGIQLGLNIYAPCQGITTDNLIAQLDDRRQEILQQMDTLDDTARRNGFPPDILTNASERAAALEAPLTPEEAQGTLKERARDLARQLDDTREVVQASNAQAQSQGITLSGPRPNAGGTMTTNMLQNLDNRAQALQNEISEVEDQARQNGIDPGLLR